MSLSLVSVEVPRLQLERATPFPLLAQHPTQPHLIAYPHGRNVYVQQGDQIKTVYASHAYAVRAVRWSPSGLISADERGHIHGHELSDDLVVQRAKQEWEFGTGLQIRDLHLVSPGQLLVVGEGRECQAALLNLERGSVTPLPGHTKRINGVASNAKWILTASDDLSLGVYAKQRSVEFSRTIKGLHSKPIQTVISLGNDFATAGSDGKICVLNGDSLDLIWSAVASNNSGASASVMALSERGGLLRSVSTDGRLREWRQGEVVRERVFGSQLLAVSAHHVASLAHGLSVLTDEEEQGRREHENQPEQPREHQPLEKHGEEEVYAVATVGNLRVLGLNKAVLVGTKRVEVGLGPITAIAIGSAYLAVADAERRVRLLQRATLEVVPGIRWCHHASRVTGLVWIKDDDDDEFLVSVSLDGQLALLHPSKALAPLWQAPAGQGCLKAVHWRDAQLITVGEQDTRHWRLTK